MKAEYSTKDLFSRLLIFEKLDEKVKLDIFKVSCRNNFRYLQLPTQSQIQALKHILEANNIQELMLLVRKMVKKIDIKLTHANLDNGNYLKKFLEIEILLQVSQLDKWKSSVILNAWLIQNNLCPLLRFAFDRWYDISQNNDRSLIPSLVELSTVYLYRLAPTKDRVDTHGIHFADGAHNSLFLLKKAKRIEKIPRSIGAKYFINDQEVKTTKLLLKSALKDYIPCLVDYNRTTKVITRQYIRGKTGHKLLASNFFDNNKKAIKDLKRFFKLYKETKVKLKINLDIHPGNFIWSEKKQKWFFVDTGPIPLIGSEYFPLDSFKNYFQKIWIERHQRIKEMPIRSVDLGL